MRNELLAVAIPALSPAAGKTVTGVPDRNRNMNVDFKPTNGDWGRDGMPYYKRWLHSDMKVMAYLYTHLLFDKLVDEGDLK